MLTEGMHEMRRAWRAAAPALMLVVLAACAAPVEPVETPDAMRFTEKPPIGLSVARVEIETMDTGERVDHEVLAKFAVPPEEAMRQWARDRLQAGGGTGVGRFTILTAAVEEEKQQPAKGAVGWVSPAPGGRYTITVEGRLEILAEGGQRGMTAAKVARAKTLEPGLTAGERTRALYDLTLATMTAFDEQMERAIRRHLNPWVL
jgi:hypothetical protein